MKFVLPALVLVVVCSALPSHVMFDAELDPYWSVFKEMHNKRYEGTEEFIRRGTWEKNLKYIRRHNLEADFGVHNHRLGMNEYGDLSDKEYHSLLKGLVPFNVTEETPTFIAPDHTDMPDMVDWRKKGYVTGVKNQGSCGSCWAFSATGSLEGQHFKKTQKLVSLSEQNIVDCAKKFGAHGCKGGSMDTAFKYIEMNHGVDTEASYPYTAKDGTCKFSMSDIGATDMGSMNIPRDDEDALMKAVATVGPISVAIDASAKDFRFYKTGVYTSTECSKTELDHGVLAVGFGEEMGDKYWLVKNSWGKTWGHEGYIMMRKDHNNMCGIATSASYPLV